MRKFLKVAFGGISAGMVALFFATTPAASFPSAQHGKSVCETGYRGQKLYDALCLRHGTPGDAAKLWFDTPEGKPGHLRDDFTTRRAICAYADRHGGVRAQGKELVNDMAYDTYTNYKQVIRWVQDTAQGDCLRMGYADAASGLVSVNLHNLPGRDCWYEVSYLDRKHTRVNVEPLCKG